jgi:polysaccharide biosynthesis protein PslE
VIHIGVLPEKRGFAVSSIIRSDATMSSGVPGDGTVVPSTGNRRRTGKRSLARRSAAPAPRRSLPSGISPRDLLFILFKFKTRALLVAASVFLLALLAAMFMPSKFKSEAQLQVKAGRDTISIDPTASIGQSQLVTTDFHKQVQTERQILASQAVAAKTVDLLGLPFFGADDETDPDKRDRAISRIASSLTSKVDVAAVKDTAILAVAYTSSNPTDAQKLVGAYVDAYLLVRAQSRLGPQTEAFLSRQSDEARERLKKVQTQILKLKLETGVSEPEEQKKILLARIANLQTEIDKANAEQAGTVGTVKAIEDQLAVTPREIRTQSTIGAPMGALDQAKNKLNTLRQQEAELLTKFLPDAIPVQQIRDQIAATEKQVAELAKGDGEVTMGLNPNYISLEGNLKVAQARRDALDQTIATLAKNIEQARGGLQQLDTTEFEMKRLALEAGVAEEAVRRLAQGVETASTDRNMAGDKDAGNVSVTQAATFNEKPVAPSRPMILLGGLFAALACGVGSALVSELLDPRITRPIDLFKVGCEKVVSIPVLPMSRSVASDDTSDDEQGPVDLSVHEITAKGDVAVSPQTIDISRPTRFVRSAARPGVSIAAQRSIDDPTLSAREVLERLAREPALVVIPTGPASNGATSQQGPVQVTVPMGRPALSPRFLDAAAAILERLVFTPVSTGRMEMPRTLAIVGATPGQGVTTLAAHLAAVLSDQLPMVPGDAANKVLLLDANLISPGAHRIMDVPAAPGVAEWLMDASLHDRTAEQIARPTALQRLDVLTAGLAAQSCQPGRWADAVLAAIGSRYHNFVIDLPALSRCTAAARVAGQCDAAILVVECGEGKREVVREAVARLHESGVHLLGVVLNKRSFPIPEQLYRRV